MTFLFTPSHTIVPVTGRFPPRLCRRRRFPRGCLIGVVGATGGVGSLLTSKLLARISCTNDGGCDGTQATGVRALVRNAKTAKERLEEKVEIVEIGSTFECDERRLRDSLKDVEVLFICTGTTAFPTRAWHGGNWPRNVDDVGVRRLMECVDVGNIRRVVLLSSIGTERANKFPFVVLNLFGVLDAKRRGEQHVKRVAREGGFGYVVVKAGRLIGKPHSNVGVVKIKEKKNWEGLEMKRGDVLKGDLSRECAAEVVMRAGLWSRKGDLDFAVVNKKGQRVCGDEVDVLLNTMKIERKTLHDSIVME